jgi:hypothetical protein
MIAPSLPLRLPRCRPRHLLRITLESGMTTLTTLTMETHKMTALASGRTFLPLLLLLLLLPPLPPLSLLLRHLLKFLRQPPIFPLPLWFVVCFSFFSFGDIHSAHFVLPLSFSLRRLYLEVKMRRCDHKLRIFCLRSLTSQLLSLRFPHLGITTFGRS